MKSHKQTLRFPKVDYIYIVVYTSRNSMRFKNGIDDVNDLRLLVDDDGNFSNATVYGPADGLTFTLGSITVGGITTGAGGMLPVGPKFVTIGSTTEDSPLPVEMLSFDVSKQDILFFPFISVRILIKSPSVTFFVLFNELVSNISISIGFNYTLTIFFISIRHI